MKLYQDLGGTPNRDGMHVAPNCLLRSGCLHRLRKGQAKDLLAHNVGEIIDLRTDVEAADRPDKSVEGVRYMRIPVFEERVVGITRERNQKYVAMLRDMKDIGDLYQAMVTDDYCVRHLGEVVKEIVCNTNGAVLYHCTAGKDRTGLVTMLLLRLLNVSDEVILQNYLSINRRQRPTAIACYWLAIFLTWDKKLAQKAKDYFTAKPEYLIGAIKTIEEVYGSIDAFLTNQAGISEEEKQAFCNRVLA